MLKIFRKVAIRYTCNQAPSPYCRISLAGRAWRAALGCMIMLVLAGCSCTKDASQPADVLIRADQQTVTMVQFERAFTVARLACSDERPADPRMIQAARRRLLQQMTEELIVDRRAQELGIGLDDEDLEAAIGEIKRDYPENEFEQMLLEKAIPFSLWKERLQKRLLMEKVIDRDLVQSQNISPQEIEAYYKTHENEFDVSDSDVPEAGLNRRIVERLRREKVEIAYPQWIEELRKRYRVTINWKLWQQAQQTHREPDGRKKEALP